MNCRSPDATQLPGAPRSKPWGRRILWSKRIARLGQSGSPQPGPADHSGRTFGTFAAQGRRQIVRRYVRLTRLDRSAGVGPDESLWHNRPRRSDRNPRR
jgi:hypothetical protein